MQIVYISNRPEILFETLGHVSALMPFIDKALVCVPDAHLNQFGDLNTAVPMDVIAESSILSTEERSNLHNLDHQRRNYLLRTRLLRSNQIEDRLIMSDDDARPLRLIKPSTYISTERLHSYYFYSLGHWDNHRTEFDAGQLATFSVLNALGYPTKSFASHMPQVIDKETFLQAGDKFRPYSDQHPLCEWSTYFNFAISEFPEKFHSPSDYVSLCWPEHPLAWEQDVVPHQFLFENFTPELYRPGQVFEGLPTEFQSAEVAETVAIEKVNRWRKHMVLSRHPEQAEGMAKYLNWRTWINKLVNHISQDRRQT